MAKEERRKTVSIEQEELRGISRTVAEIHWLLLILVLLYLVFGGERPGADAESEAAVAAGLFFYAALVMSFRYANFYKRETRWKIALEALGMISFITWVLWYTDRLESPLVNLYLLPVITSALTLGKLATLANVGLIVGQRVNDGGRRLLARGEHLGERLAHQRRGVVEQHDHGAFGGGPVVVREIGIEVGPRQRAGGFGAFAGRCGAQPVQELTDDHADNRVARRSGMATGPASSTGKPSVTSGI